MVYLHIWELTQILRAFGEGVLEDMGADRNVRNIELKMQIIV